MYFPLRCFKIQFYRFIVNCYWICFKLNLISNCFILLPSSFISFLFRFSLNFSLSIALIYFIALQFSSLSLISYFNLVCIVIIKNLKNTKIPIRNLTILDPEEVKEGKRRFLAWPINQLVRSQKRKHNNPTFSIQANQWLGGGMPTQSKRRTKNFFNWPTRSKRRQHNLAHPLGPLGFVWP